MTDDNKQANGFKPSGNCNEHGYVQMGYIWEHEKDCTCKVCASYHNKPIVDRLVAGLRSRLGEIC